MITPNKKTLTVSIDSEFVSTVKFYLDPDSKMRKKIMHIRNRCIDWDLCRAEDSELYLSFKRQVLFHLYHFYHTYRHSVRSWECPWHIDDCALSCASMICRCIDDWYNCGE